MERTRKTIDAKIAAFEAKKAQYQTRVDIYKAKISEIDAKMQELRDIQKQKELENLLDVIKASGKTAEEVIASLKSENS